MPDMAAIRPPAGAPKWPGELAGDVWENRGFFINEHHKFPLKVNMRSMQNVNGVARDIYDLIDGQRTGDQVYQALMNKHKQPYGTIRESIYTFMATLVTRGHASLSPVPDAGQRKTYGSVDYFYPAHISIEVTAQCNIRCIHCYGTFEQKRFDALNADALIEYLETMYAKGLRSIELTGGECTTHPEFHRILSWCVDKLEMIAVLTNAVAIKEEVFETIIGAAEKTLVQICINGTREYHNKFTKSTIAYDRAMAALTRLAKGGVYVRTPMNLTAENYMQLEEVAAAVREAGSSNFIGNFVDGAFGRAQSLEITSDKHEEHHIDAKAHAGHQCDHVKNGDSAYTCAEQAAIMKSARLKLIEMQERFPGFVSAVMSEEAQELTRFEKACGAGRRSVYVASNGKVGICPMSVESGIPGFGDLNHQSMEEIVNGEYARHLSRLPAPNDADCTAPNGDPCPHRPEHKGCVLHGVMQYMKTPKTCWWGQKHDVEHMVDVGHHSLTKNADGSWNLGDLAHIGTGCGSSSRGTPIAPQQLTVRGRLKTSASPRSSRSRLYRRVINTDLKALVKIAPKSQLVLGIGAR